MAGLCIGAQVKLKAISELGSSVGRKLGAIRSSHSSNAVAIFALTSSLMGGTACDMYSLVPDTQL